jgi:hypothetical protein
LAEKIKKENQDLQLDIQRLSDELIRKQSEISKITSQNEVLKNALANYSSGVDQPINDIVKQLDQQASKSIAGFRERSNSWEVAKLNQKKMEHLKEKLKLKTAETETLKENVARSERDRLRLQSKIQKQLETQNSQSNQEKKSEVRSSHDYVQLEAKNHALQTALMKASKRKLLKKHDNIPSLINDDELAEKSTSELISIIATLKTKDREGQELAKEISRLKSDLQKAIDSEKAARESVSHVAKLDEVNTQLRTKLRKESERAKAAINKNDELSITNEQLIKDIVSLRKLISGVPENQSKAFEQTEMVEELKRQAQDKEKLIQELLSNPDSNEGSRLTSENRRLKRELEMWKIRVTKLSSETKPVVSNTQLYEENESLKNQVKTLTEEVEDIKFNYKNLLKKSISA